MASENAGKTAIIAVSRPGAALARRLASNLPGTELHLERRLADESDEDVHLYDLPLRPVLQNLFVNRDALIVFLPLGAAVRLLAPVFAGKKRDPAVVCVDDGGRYAISLLSGHVGGADELSRQVAEAIGAQAVITSASDALNVTAIDLVGRKAGWRIEASATDLTRAAAAVVNGEPVALWLDPATGAGWPEDSTLADGIVIVDSPGDAGTSNYAATLVVSDRLPTLDTKRPLVIYRPPTLVVGVGCRRGVGVEHLQKLLDDTLRDSGLAGQSIAKIATVDLKADEPGIIELADALGVPLQTYAADELNAAAHREPQPADSQRGLHRPTPSAASDLLGVFGVAEPAAMLAAGAGGVIVPRAKPDRATIAVARVPTGRQDGTEAAAMTTHEPETTLPGEGLLAMAEGEINKGNLQQGAGLVWEATMEALAAAGERYGMPCGNREEARLVAKRLDRTGPTTREEASVDVVPAASGLPAKLGTGARSEPDIAEYWHQLRFDLADSFREHYEDLDEFSGTELEWEPEEYAAFLEPVRSFIKSLNDRQTRDSAR